MIIAHWTAECTRNVTIITFIMYLVFNYIYPRLTCNEPAEDMWI